MPLSLWFWKPTFFGCSVSAVMATHSKVKFFSFVLFLFLVTMDISLRASGEAPTTVASYDSCMAAATSVSCGPFTNFSFPFAPVTPAGCGHPDFQIECDSVASSTAKSTAVITINGHRFTVTALESPFMLRLGLDDPLTEICMMKPNTTFLDFGSSPFHLRLKLRAVKPGDVGVVVFNKTGCLNMLGWLPCGPCDLLEKFMALGENLMSIVNDLIKYGIGVSWTEADERFRECKECMGKKNGLCGFNALDSKKGFLCYPHSATTRPQGLVNNFSAQPPSGESLHGRQDAPPNATDGYRRWMMRVILIFASMVFVIAMMVALAATIHFCRGRAPIAVPSDEIHGVSTVGNKHASESKIIQPQLQVVKLLEEDQIPTFSYKELEEATNCFDKESVLGDGGYGCVYRGYLSNGCLVAVKRMIHQTNTLNQFHNEIRMMTKLKHPNLVSLLGSCKADRDLLLVYEYVSNGTLADHLHGMRRGRHMTLEARVKIASQTAQALAYMHFEVTPTVVHRDVKSSNILIQPDLSVKLADFGLSRDMAGMEGASHVSTLPQGTLGYVDPEYYRSYRLTQTSDVYSFGVVLMELITGMKALDYGGFNRGETTLANLAVSAIQRGRLVEIVDPFLSSAAIAGGAMLKVIEEMAELGFMCLAACKDDRPNMKEVSLRLQRIEQYLLSEDINNII